MQKEWHKLYPKRKKRKVPWFGDKLWHLKRYFSYQCLLCQSHTTHPLCLACQSQFLLSPTYTCNCCGLPLFHHTLLCGDCLKNTPHFDTTFSPYLYQAPLSDLLRDFKHQHDFLTGWVLSHLLSQEVSQHYQQQALPLPDLLVPVPLHWKRHWLRGFNQSSFLADTLSRDLSIPIFSGAKRMRPTAEQKQLNKQQRQRNLNNHFQVTQVLAGQHIAIIDDVMTTGATANALAKSLKASGAKQVSVWVLARTAKYH